MLQQLSTSDIFPLVITYIVAYSVGLFISKFWMWLRVLAVIFILNLYFSNFDFQEVTLRICLFQMLPICLLIFQPLRRIFDFGALNPFGWLREKMKKRRYLKHRAKVEKEDELKRKKELEQMERIIRMQAEEAEKQRQFEREKAQEEAKRRQEEKPKSKAGTKKTPYEVLGVSESDSLEEIRKAYTELSKKYHPDHVSHLGEEFQAMAHEKFIGIKDAWDEIQRRRKKN